MGKTVDQLIDELLQREGGYTDNPNDRGGPTNFGITEHVARAHGYNGSMRDLPKQVAKNIYNELYWTAPNYDQVAQRFPAVAAELFDTGVNMGQQRASKMLQRALNVLNKGQSSYPDLIVDGVLGRMSMFALDQYKAKRGKDAEKVLLRLLDAQQAVRYMEIAEANPSQEEFMFGWVLNRVGT